MSEKSSGGESGCGCIVTIIGLVICCSILSKGIEQLAERLTNIESTIERIDKKVHEETK